MNATPGLQLAGLHQISRLAVLIPDVRPLPTTGLHKLGHHVLNSVFIDLTIGFTWAALRPVP